MTIKKLLSLVLAAALLLGLGAVAYAVGMSIYRQRQEELRQELQIDERDGETFCERDIEPGAWFYTI